MTIYLDIVFLENFILNYIIILSTAIISKSNIRINRIIIASIIGGIYSILNYIVEYSFFSDLIIKILISIIMVIVSFGDFKIAKVFKQTVFFYLVSFTFGGIAFMIIFTLKPENIIIKNNHFIGTYPLKIAVLSGGVGFIIISIISQIIKNKKGLILYDLEIYYKGRIKKIKTMMDTGNLLKEPITKADVIIVEKDSLKEIVSENILNNISNIIVDINYLTNIHEYNFKLIPFSSLGNENGLLIGFKPDYIKIYADSIHVRDDVIIGIYNGKLSKNNSYTSLIGLEILNKEAKKNEYFENV